MNKNNFWKKCFFLHLPRDLLTMCYYPHSTRFPWRFSCRHKNMQTIGENETPRQRPGTPGVSGAISSASGRRRRGNVLATCTGGSHRCATPNGEESRRSWGAHGLTSPKKGEKLPERELSRSGWSAANRIAQWQPPLPAKIAICGRLVVHRKHADHRFRYF